MSRPMCAWSAMTGPNTTPAPRCSSTASYRMSRSRGTPCPPGTGMACTSPPGHGRPSRRATPVRSSSARRLGHSTVTNPQADGCPTVYPDGTPRPTVSPPDFAAGRNRSARHDGQGRYKQRDRLLQREHRSDRPARRHPRHPELRDAHGRRNSTSPRRRRRPTATSPSTSPAPPGIGTRGWNFAVLRTQACPPTLRCTPERARTERDREESQHARALEGRTMNYDNGSTPK